MKLHHTGALLGTNVITDFLSISENNAKKFWFIFSIIYVIYI